MSFLYLHKACKDVLTLIIPLHILNTNVVEASATPSSSSATILSVNFDGASDALKHSEENSDDLDILLTGFFNTFSVQPIDARIQAKSVIINAIKERQIANLN